MNKYTSYGEDRDFVSSYIPVTELVQPGGKGRLLVAGALQGRVLTSSANGDQGRSYGWINRAHFTSGVISKKMNVYGGEERFWLGPEGGQFALFFEKGSSFDLDNWHTPRLIDLDDYPLVASTANSASFEKMASIKNYAGFEFKLKINRKIELLSQAAIQNHLGVAISSEVQCVAYLSSNSLTNIGAIAWKKETGLLSIWLLGMYNASDANTVVIPFHHGTEELLGKSVTDDYFGKVPSDRLVVKEKVLFFSGDAKHRSKIGLSPYRAKDILGSYDAANSILTIVKFSKPEGMHDYVNSLWKHQEEPYKGDVSNSYNDGPLEDGGSEFGQFYELETSSPALALEPNESASHSQITCHFEAPASQLEALAQHFLDVSLEEITEAIQLS